MAGKKKRRKKKSPPRRQSHRSQPSITKNQFSKRRRVKTLSKKFAVSIARETITCSAATRDKEKHSRKEIPLSLSTCTPLSQLTLASLSKNTRAAVSSVDFKRERHLSPFRQSSAHT